jgi:hypothetical protein
MITAFSGFPRFGGGNMLRKVSVVLAPATLAFFVGSAVLAQPVFPKDRSSASTAVTQPEAKRPLPSGRAAGIKQAQARTNGIWNWVPFGIVGGLAALVVVSGGDDDDSTPTTGSN